MNPEQDQNTTICLFRKLPSKVYYTMFHFQFKVLTNFCLGLGGFLRGGIIQVGGIIPQPTQES